jgi:tetratricopeptide (TPR) repeat protein
MEGRLEEPPQTASRPSFPDRVLEWALSPWAAMLVAAAARAAAWVEWRRWPGSEVAILDPAWHQAWGHRIVTESWVGGDQTWQVAPGAAYLFGIGERLVGPGTAVAAGIQLAFGVLAVGALYQLGARVGGRPTAVITAWIAALCGPLVFHDLAQLNASPAIAALAASLSVALYPSERRPIRGAIAGLLLGVACWFRPNLMLLAPIVAGLAWPADRRGLPERSSAAAAVSAAVIAGFLCAFAPSFTRNLWVGGEPVLLSANSGVNLAMAQRPGLQTNLLGAASARNLAQLTESSVAEASKALGHPAKPGEADAWWRDRARENIAADPSGALSRTFRRFGLALSTIDVQDHYTWHAWQRDRAWLGSLLDPTFLLPGLAIVGVITRLRRSEDRRSTIALVAVWLIGAASLAPFVVVERYRLPILAASLPLGASGLFEIFRARRPELAVAAIAVSLVASVDPFSGRWVLPDTLAAIVGPVATPISDLNGDREANEAANIGAAFLKQNRPADAIQFYRTAVRLDPDRTEDARALGAALISTGDVAGAVGVLASASQRHQDDVDVTLALCTALMQAPKQRTNAVKVCEHAQQLAPKRWDVQYQTAMARWQAGDLFRAERDLHLALRLNPKLDLGRKALADLQAEMRDTVRKAAPTSP